jgi:tRNA1(Val) A37 N6-methylase TrmN6
MYSTLSSTLTTRIVKIEKKKNGIYFTPPNTIRNNLQYIEPFMNNVKTVLEPSCGSCEYITALQERYDTIRITGIEYNDTIFESIKSLETDTLQLIHGDFLQYETNTTYDLIIGNPPYFVMKKKDVPESYYEYFEGRPNIFILFLIKALRLLNENGILSFVLPRNFLNCLYYDKTRKYILDNVHIITILECDDSYMETKQDTIILILQHKTPEPEQIYAIPIDRFTIFGIPGHLREIDTLRQHSTTLETLGFEVTVGNIVWNMCKKELTDDSSHTLLVYSSDIKHNRLEIQQYRNDAKKNHIQRKGSREPLLVINRGYGVGEYRFTYCLLNEQEEDAIEYLIENHLICIRYKGPIQRETLIYMYKKVIASFECEKTKKFIQLYFGNNAINTTELCTIVPQYMM